MRGSAKQAATEFALVIQEALNVLGPVKVTLSAGDADNQFGLTVNRDEGLINGRWHFNLRMTIQVDVEHEDWIIRTSSYQYSLRERDRDGRREVLEYHWDLSRPPHVHVRGGKDHVPTGRVLLEDVLEYCIVEVGWRPRLPGWRETLTATKAHFQLNRHWD